MITYITIVYRQVMLSERWNAVSRQYIRGAILKLITVKLRLYVCLCYGYCQAEYYTTLNERSIPFINHVKYLGVILDRSLICGLHIENITKVTNKMPLCRLIYYS
jgi:hypothetical protein